MDDNPRDAQGVQDALQSVTDISHLHILTDSPDVIRYLRNESPFHEASAPDVVVLAVNRPAYSGRGVLEQIRHIDLHPPIIVLADPGNGPASRYLDAGAADYVVRDDLSQLSQSVMTVVKTRGAMKKLTRRQIEVLRLIAEGLSTQEIGSRLHISAKTVEAHRTEVRRRLGVDSVAGLVQFAIRMSLVELRRP